MGQTSRGVRLFQWGCNYDSNQIWNQDHRGLMNVKSAKCLDVPNDEVNNNGAQVQQWDCLY